MGTIDFPVLGAPETSTLSSQALKRLLSDIEGRSDVMGGTPVFRGTRIPLRLIVSLLQAGMTPEDVVSEYEGRLELEAVRAALESAWQVPSRTPSIVLSTSRSHDARAAQGLLWSGSS